MHYVGFTLGTVILLVLSKGIGESIMQVLYWENIPVFPTENQYVILGEFSSHGIARTRRIRLQGSFTVEAKIDHGRYSRSRRMFGINRSSLNSKP